MQDDAYTWQGDIVHEAEQESAAPQIRSDRQDGTVVVTIGNVDLPAFISDGKLYVQAPLPHVFKAFAEDLSDFLRDMEVRVSVKGGPPLSLDSHGRPVSSAAVAKSRVVRRSRVSR